MYLPKQTPSPFEKKTVEKKNTRCLVHWWLVTRFFLLRNNSWSKKIYPAMHKSWKAPTDPAEVVGMVQLMAERYPFFMFKFWWKNICFTHSCLNHFLELNRSKIGVGVNFCWNGCKKTLPPFQVDGLTPYPKQHKIHK